MIIEYNTELGSAAWQLVIAKEIVQKLEIFILLKPTILLDCYETMSMAN